MSALRIGFRWPRRGSVIASDNFFLGAWHPEREVVVSWEGEAPVPVATMHAGNWALASAVSPLHGTDGSLLHRSTDAGTALAFRGYLVDPPLHSYSAGERLLGYWAREAGREHNGVFSVARIGDGGATLMLATDLMGFSPLYFARLEGAVIFATNPRFLAIAGSQPDRIAWRSLLESGFICSDRSLTTGVQRLPAGKMLRATRDGVRFDSWLALESLPPGDRPLDAHGIAAVESELHRAMDRCLALQDLRVLLPLSSGHDSRRLLGSLLRRGQPFEALTCRVFHRGRDLDARYAAEMANDLGFEHRIIEPCAPAAYALHDRTRQILTDAETTMHSWVPQLMRSLPATPAMLLDGVAGDILGNPGFRIPGLYQSRAQDIDIVLGESLPGAFDNLLDASIWPSPETVRADLRDYLLALPQRVNLAEFAFILLRQRRTTAPWSQQLLPPGYVAVCPFLDLDYLRLLLSFVPADKHAVILQRRCLAEFWPDLYRYPGTRDVPDHIQPRPPRIDDDLTLACAELTLREIEDGGGLGTLRKLLSMRGRLVLAASRMSRGMMRRTNWHLATIEELVLREVDRTAGWRVHGAGGP